MRFPFTLEARAQLRAIDRAVALRILKSIAHFGATATGDVEPMHGEWQEHRPDNNPADDAFYQQLPAAGP